MQQASIDTQANKLLSQAARTVVSRLQRCIRQHVPNCLVRNFREPSSFEPIELDLIHSTFSTFSFAAPIPLLSLEEKKKRMKRKRKRKSRNAIGERRSKDKNHGSLQATSTPSNHPPACEYNIPQARDDNLAKKSATQQRNPFNHPSHKRKLS